MGYSEDEIIGAIGMFVEERNNGKKPTKDGFAGLDFLQECENFILAQREAQRPRELKPLEQNPREYRPMQNIDRTPCTEEEILEARELFQSKRNKSVLDGLE